MRNLTKFGTAVAKTGLLRAKALAMTAAGFVAVFGLLNLLTPAAAEGSPLSDAPVVKALTAGGAHACGIFNESGVVYCWGSNERGQLGVGDNVSRARPEVAVDLNGKKAVSIAAGFEHTCAITDDYGIYCWGANDKMQLGGYGTTVDSNVPVSIWVGFEPIELGILASGFSISCGAAPAKPMPHFVGDAAVFCWGDGSDGQFGDGRRDDNNPIFGGLWGEDSGTEVSDLAIGTGHSCAVIAGAVKCSGAGGNGQLGDGLFSDSLTPVDVEGIVGEAVEVSAGYFMSCAASDNGFYCWGDDTSGQLGGDGVAGEATELMSWGAALPIASGYAHSCAGFWCIGENGSGQLGDGSTVNRDEMTSVDLSGVLAGLSVKDVVAGFDFTCWVAGEAGTGLLDAAFCSGAGVDGQLGDNLNNNSDVPVAVDFSQVEREETYVNLSTDVNKVELTVQPSGSVAAGAVNLTVVTNNFKGYDLSIKTDNENLVCQDNASYVIAKQSPDGAALAVNHWGYETGPTEPAAWNGVTTSDVTIDSLGTATSESGQPTKAWFGAKADFSLPACVYNGTATFTAVAVV